MPLLEWTLNLCVFHQPSIHLLVHAAVVERDGFAAILPGGAGAGKSTLCAALIYRGWRLLSDEVAVIRLSDGQVLPAPRPVSLKEDSIETLQRFAPEAMLGPVWPKTAKGRLGHLIPPKESVLRMDEAAAPAWVVFPSFQTLAGTALNAVPKAQALIECADHAFNYSLHGRQGFETLASLIDACGCYELIYSNLDEGVAELDRLAGRHQGEMTTANARRG